MATTEYIKTPAIKFLQGKYEYYMTSLSSQKLFDVSFISRRSEDKKEGFQRLLRISLILIRISSFYPLLRKKLPRIFPILMGWMYFLYDIINYKYIVFRTTMSNL